MSEQAVAAWRAKWGEGPHLTADVVVFTLRPPQELAVLLIERGIPPFVGQFAIPGGFVQLNEDPADAALRELAEETGVERGVSIDQLATFGAPGRDPRGRVVTIAHLALVPWDRVAHARGGDDASAATFFAIRDGHPVDDRGKRLRLAFDHDEVIHMAVERLRARVTYTTAPFALMPAEFTLAELQAAYEAILERPLHRRAFRERVEREQWVDGKYPRRRASAGAHLSRSDA